jgi:hypothetical protein
VYTGAGTAMKTGQDLWRLGAASVPLARQRAAKPAAPRYGVYCCCGGEGRSARPLGEVELTTQRMRSAKTDRYAPGKVAATSASSLSEEMVKSET